MKQGDPMGRHYFDDEPKNRWKGYVLGLCGGLAGVCAMNAFMTKTTPYFEKMAEAQQTKETPDESMSLVGKQQKGDESATEAVGRILYNKAAGEEPKSKELKKTLGEIVHWGYGAKMGAAYGFMRPRNGALDLTGGLTYGAGLWLGGDEIALPLLGLSKAPNATPPAKHVQALAAHLVYGVTTAVTTNLLRKIF